MGAADDRAEVKGYALLSYLVGLRDHPALWDAVCADLATHDPPAGLFYGEAIYAHQWYPRVHLHALLEAVDRVSVGDEGTFRRLGARAAEYQIGLIYRVFLAFASPALVFRRAGTIWKRQSTVGDFSVIEDGDDHLVGLLDDPHVPPRLPALIAGWSDRVVSMLGRQPLPTEVIPLARGRYRFLVRWR